LCSCSKLVLTSKYVCSFFFPQANCGPTFVPFTGTRCNVVGAGTRTGLHIHGTAVSLDSHAKAHTKLGTTMRSWAGLVHSRSCIRVARHDFRYLTICLLSFFKSAGRFDTMFRRHISLSSNFDTREFNARNQNINFWTWLSIYLVKYAGKHGIICS
jgi:hypothetical protein